MKRLYGTVAVVTVGPLVWMLMTGLKTYEETVRVPPTFFPETMQWQNFVTVYKDLSFGTLFSNTIIVVGCVVVVQLFISLMAAYAFAKLDFPFKKTLFVMLLSVLMVPGQIFLIPQYNIIVALGLPNTLLALMLPSFFSVFALFFFRQFLYSIPMDRIFFTIIIPPV